ncbi:subtilisin-like protein [Aureobasidium pullulans]|nr:subtilisin-like protein [Aureobasidium pullulans]THY49803.1 subtilisin-like protein [Aureobasidium pullulans]TIA78298.1 subtilisin-like protein [Aureobasidium pullulans]
MPSMHLFTFGILALLLPNAIAAPTSNTAAYAVKERHDAPQGWTKITSPVEYQTISLQIALKQQNSDALTKIALEVSDPSHPRYGQYLSAKQLLGHGIDTAALSSTRDWINVDLPVLKVESLLNTTYSLYRHTDGSTLVRTSEWSLPEDLHKYIDLIQPTTSFFRSSKPSIRPAHEHVQVKRHQEGDRLEMMPDDVSSPEACDIRKLCDTYEKSLSCLRCLYGTNNYIVQASEKNMIAVANYENETQKRSDIKLYLEQGRPEAAAVAGTFADTFPIIQIAGAPDYQGPLSKWEKAYELRQEANMDAELAIGISWPTPFMAWSTGVLPPPLADWTNLTIHEEFLAWLNHVLDQDSIPQVISTSYGDDEHMIPYSFATSICDGFKQLAVRGVSVIFASGDDGVGSRKKKACSAPKDPFTPLFPASCPWVTSVGATEGFEPEIAVESYGSGAGFSNYFPMPPYQVDAVHGYLEKLGGLHKGRYNRSGRGYPDVAAQGRRISIVWEGQSIVGGGTSASAPIFAAVIALVNDARIAAGKPVLGFLNPWIYGGAFQALTDIIDGSSFGCSTDGFPSEVGWDAVTGFGTPNLDNLIEAALGVFEA